MHKQTLTKNEKVISLRNGRQLSLSRPLIMGILNLTPDSFSDGGLYLTNDKAIEHAKKMIADGADILDIGGESSRPGAEPISDDEEIKRVIPVLKKIRQFSDIPISIDTYRATTAKEAISAGADLINDITALRADSRMTDLLAKEQVPLILMHMLGTPKDMQVNPTYVDCVAEISKFFEERIHFAADNGIDQSNLILDPGIGFGKRLSDNLDILSSFNSFSKFNLPLLVGASRKSFIGMIDPANDSPNNRLGGSLTAAIIAVQNGASIVRVHDVSETVNALKIFMAIKEDL